MRRTILCALIVGSTMLSALPANAQATRTWVSQATGDDLFACSRIQPCRTFAGAIGKTAINGEINCIDAGGYGSVTITKSITIDCTGTYGSILAGTCASQACSSTSCRARTIRIARCACAG